MGYYDDERIVDPSGRRLMSLGQSLAYGKRKFRKETAMALGQQQKDIQDKVDAGMLKRKELAEYGLKSRAQMKLTAGAGLRDAQTKQLEVGTAKDMFALETDKLAVPTLMKQIKLKNQRADTESKLFSEMFAKDTDIPLDDVKAVTGRKLLTPQAPKVPLPLPKPIKPDKFSPMSPISPTSKVGIKKPKTLNPEAKLRRLRKVHKKENAMSRNTFNDYLRTLSKTERAKAISRRRRGGASYKDFKGFMDIGESKQPEDITAVHAAEKPLRDLYRNIMTIGQ